MKSIFISSLFMFSLFGFNNDNFNNSIWICRINATCVDTLKFEKDRHVSNYSCESDYTYKGTYVVTKNILTITQKDDSHDEDGAKPEVYRLKFIIKNNKLYPQSNEKFENGKWIKAKEVINKFYVFSKMKK
jgi:hypothetical protein